CAVPVHRVGATGSRASMAAPDRQRNERRRRAQVEGGKLPAGLEDSGRDERLVHPPEVQPSGARSDRRQSVPGTMVPGAAAPAEASDEWPWIERADDSPEAEEGDSS